MIVKNYINATPLRANFKSSLIDFMTQNLSTVAQKPINQNSVGQTLTLNPAQIPVSTPNAQIYNKQVSLMNSPVASQVSEVSPLTLLHPASFNNYKNNLRSMFQNNQAVIYAMVPRTFGAKDTNGNGLIEANETPGYFTNMVEHLDELKSYGINTLHWLPINPTGLIAAKGNAGSVYAPADFLSIDPMLDDPKDSRSVFEEAKYAIEQCHKKGIKVMLDLPSCMSVDLYEARPDLSAIDADNNPKTPEGWEDIRMFEVWEDSDKRILNKNLVDYHKSFIDMCLDLGIDGIRADVGRAKPPEFWDIIISYARSKDPEFAFLAECYTYEDASPMKNMPADRPKESLAAGFDSYYGQYHIFNTWNETSFHDFIKENIALSKDLEKGKSLIGSFATHDDRSPMANGGADYCMMTSVVQTTLPMTNPYIVSGFEYGDRYIYDYNGEYIDKTFKELLQNPVQAESVNVLSTVTNEQVLHNLQYGADGDKKLKELAEHPTYKGVIEFWGKYSTTKDNIKYYVHSEKLDIFNTSRGPKGDFPEIGQHFGYLMNCVRPKYGELITKGSYIPLKVQNNVRGEVIAYARHKDGKTLVTIVNHDVNARQKVKVVVPGLQSSQVLEDIAPEYGQKSSWSVSKNAIEIDLGPARAHIFEVDTPEIEKAFKPEKVLQQNL